MLAQMPTGSVDCVITSPPYFGLRDYGSEGQYGLEATPAEYVETMRAVFAEARRVLADDGTLWLNLGDSYAGKANAGPAFAKNRGQNLQPVGYPVQRNTLAHAPYKSLLGMPWRVAFALIDDGWILRSDIIWAKPNPMPEAVSDRPTSSHEHVFMLTKSPRYYYDPAAIAVTATGRGSGNGFVRDEQINRGGPGQDEAWEGRPQLRRALELARQKGLTEHHFAAIRAVGMNDAGKAKVNQSGTGKNAAQTQELADEAKAALGGYYREFLTGGTKNARDVWTIPVVGFSEAHFACMPPALAERAVLAGCRPGGTVLDPFSGSGTTGLAATKHGRRYVGVDLSSDYLDLSLRTRFAQPGLDLTPGGAA
ncbi:site-specific DNA-methyltransferase [Nocardioides lentus]|uniref:DNA-methyltransferase n=1 Tax=Nocardioides lentus TaxID=338077 RepID=UPI0031D9CF95